MPFLIICCFLVKNKKIILIFVWTRPQLNLHLTSQSTKHKASPALAVILFKRLNASACVFITCLCYFWVLTSRYPLQPHLSVFIVDLGHWSLKWHGHLQITWKLKAALSSLRPTGAWACCRRWTRPTSWTWSTSPSGSSPSPSPAVWTSRATPPTCGRWPPCCAPNTATTTWYSSFLPVLCWGRRSEFPTPNQSLPDQPFVSWSLPVHTAHAQVVPHNRGLMQHLMCLFVGCSCCLVDWGSSHCNNTPLPPPPLKLLFKISCCKVVPQL